MQGFEPVTLSWSGESYTVPAEGQLMLIAKIEDALSGASGRQAIEVLMQYGGPSYTKLSQAFGAALRHAGADVSDEDIYLSIQADLARNSADVIAKVQSAILALLAIVSPPIAMAMRDPAPKKKPHKRKRKA